MLQQSSILKPIKCSRTNWVMLEHRLQISRIDQLKCNIGPDYFREWYISTLALFLSGASSTHAALSFNKRTIMPHALTQFMIRLRILFQSIIIKLDVWGTLLPFDIIPGVYNKKYQSQPVVTHRHNRNHHHPSSSSSCSPQRRFWAVWCFVRSLRVFYAAYPP